MNPALEELRQLLLTKYAIGWDAVAAEETNKHAVAELCGQIGVWLEPLIACGSIVCTRELGFAADYITVLRFPSVRTRRDGLEAARVRIVPVPVTNGTEEPQFVDARASMIRCGLVANLVRSKSDGAWFVTYDGKREPFSEDVLPDVLKYLLGLEVR